MVYASASGNFNRIAEGTTYLFNNHFKYGYKTKDILFDGSAKWIYGANPEKLTSNDFNASLDCNLYKTFPHFYYWGLANFTSSYSLRIRQQWQTGLGVVYRFIDKESMVLSVSDGILFEHSDIINEEGVNIVYQTFRNSLRLQYHVNHKDKIQVKFTGFYQPSLQYANDYNISVVSSLEIKLWKWLRANAAFNYNQISRTERENVLITYGLVAEKFF